jgi:hypothetical protein
MSDSELQARIALLEYYNSLMQGYKVYILTFGVAILTVVEVWSRTPKLTTTNFLMSFFLGAIVSAIVISCFRFLWCGHIVTSAIRAPAPSVPTMGNLDDQIKSYAHDPTKWTEPIKPSLSRRSRIKRRAQRLWMWLILRGDSKILLAFVYVAMLLVFGTAIFYFFAPLFGIACMCPLDI